jgi:hypothetical protein
VEDKIFYESETSHRAGVLIEPIPREIQILWRKQFSEEQAETEKNILLRLLEGEGSAPFNEFARRLRENPLLMKAWNRYHQKLLTDHVRAWAETNNISADRWSAGPTHDRLDGSSSHESLSSPGLGQRAALYNFLDNLPIDDLLELRVPLGWLVKVTRDKQ